MPYLVAPSAAQLRNDIVCNFWRYSVGFQVYYGASLSGNGPINLPWSSPLRPEPETDEKPLRALRP